MDNYSTSGTTSTNTGSFTPVQIINYTAEQARQDLDEALSEENIIKVLGSSLKPIVNTQQEVEDVRTLKEPVAQELQQVKPVAPVKSITETLEKHYLGSFFENIFVRSKHSPKNIFSTFRKAEGSLILKPKLENWLQWLKDNPDPKGADHKNWLKEYGYKKASCFNAIIGAGISRPYQELKDETGGIRYDDKGKVLAIGTGRNEDITELSKIIILDFDDNMDISNLRSLEDIREVLEKDEYTSMLFLSPSQNGYKIIVKHDLTDPKEYNNMFEGLKKRYLNKYQLKADAGKDKARMCYIPYIEKGTLYDNEKNAKVWHYEKKSSSLSTTDTIIIDEDFDEGHSKPLNNSNVNTVYDDSVKKTTITDELNELCVARAEFLTRHMKNIFDSYDEKLSMAFSLMDLGKERGRTIVHILNSINANYDEDITNTEYDKLFEKRDKERSGIDKFLKVSGEAIDEIIDKITNGGTILPNDEMYEKLPLMMRMALTKYDAPRKFMALLSLLGNVSGILHNLKVKHWDDEFEANTYTWIIAPSTSGKSVLNDMQELFEPIEDVINKEYDNEYYEFKKREKLAELSGETFTERPPIKQSLYVAEDTTKASLIEDLDINKGRGIVCASEAITYVGADETQYGNFMDVQNKAFSHDRISKSVLRNKTVIKKPYLSIITSSTPDTAYNFFSSARQEDGTFSRFLAFDIKLDNRLRNVYIDENIIDNKTSEELLVKLKDQYLSLWQNCRQLMKPLYLDLKRELNDKIYAQYKQFERECIYMYKINPDYIKRMQVTHKRLILELSAAFHHEKYNNFNLADLNNAMPSGWNYNLKLPVDSRAVEIADIIMKIYRYAFIGLMHNNEKYRYKRMSIPVRNDNIKTMLRNGISTKKLSDLFSLPETRIFELLPNDFDKTDRRQKHSDKQKAVAVNLANEQPSLKKQITEMLGLTVRTLDRWIKDYKGKK